MIKELLQKIKEKFKKILIIIFIISLFFVLLYFTIDSFKQITKELKIILEKFLFIINYPIIHLGKSTISISNIFVFLIILYVWVKLAWYYKKFIYSIRRKYTNNLSYSTSTILANIGYYTIITIVVLSSLKSVWIDFSNFTMIAWALSVWIWFWLQNIVSNFVSGIILMFERSIKVGDYVELTDWTRWTILDIRMRSITIKTNDNINLIIPNQNFIQNNIINRTLNDKKVRFRIPFWVAYGTPIKIIEKTILNTLQESKISHMKSGEYKPRIVMKKMNNSSIDFELYVWVRWEEITLPNRTKSEFLKMIYTTLNENNITIPFPQTDLHIKDSVPLEIKLINEAWEKIE